MVLSVLLPMTPVHARDAPEDTSPRGSVGLGLAFVRDLGDRAEPGADVGPGLSVLAPLRLSLTPAASLRVTPRLDAATGGGAPGEGRGLCNALDSVSWQVTPDARSIAPTDCGWLFAAGVTVGPEVRWPPDATVQPTLAVGVGLLGVLNVHRLEQGELTQRDPSLTRVDGWSLAAAWLTEVDLGILVGRERAWFAEVGYAAAWVPRASLRRSVEALDVAREPFGYNAVRLSTGIAWSW